MEEIKSPVHAVPNVNSEFGEELCTAEKIGEDLDNVYDDDIQDAKSEGEPDDALSMDDGEFERWWRSGSKYVGSHGGNCESCEAGGESGLNGV